jgi:DNA-binding XRE family transcriptional regulator
LWGESKLVICPDGVRERVGLNLQRLRLETGFSQEELADLAGIHETHLSGVER